MCMMSSEGRKMERQLPDQDVESVPSNPEGSINPNDIIKSAHEAAKYARNAVSSCSKSIDEANSASDLGFNHMVLTNDAANAARNKEDEYKFHDLSKMWCLIRNDICEEIYKAEDAVHVANDSANCADDCARKLAEALQTRSETITVGTQLCIEAACKAKARAHEVYRRQYWLLKATLLCWDAVDYREIPDPKSRKYDRFYRACVHSIMILFLFAWGYAMIVLSYHTKLSPEVCTMVKGAGIALIVISMTILFLLLVKETKRSFFFLKRRIKLAKYKKQLNGLSNCATEPDTDGETDFSEEDTT